MSQCFILSTALYCLLPIKFDAFNYLGYFIPILSSALNIKLKTINLVVIMRLEQNLGEVLALRRGRRLESCSVNLSLLDRKMFIFDIKRQS